MKTLTILIPVYNEGAALVPNLREIIAHVRALTHVSFNILLVDDGSTDGMTMRVKSEFAAEPSLHYLRLNYNFGKEAAIAAGLCVIKKSEAVIVMDSDLQHPPALLGQMIEKWEQGADVVEACKSARGTETRFRKLCCSIFYSAFDRLTGLQLRNQSDFKLLDRKVVDFYCSLPERERFFRGLINWMHFSTSQIQFEVPPRTHGASTWSHWRLFKYALASITSFTSFPLQIVTLCGGLTFLLSLVVGGIALADKLSGRAVDGFSTVILLILAIGSVLMFSLGLIGIYTARIYEEVKRRPAWIVDERSSQIMLDL